MPPPHCYHEALPSGPFILAIWKLKLDSGVRGAFKVLSRYSAAGADPSTFITGQIACDNFKLSIHSAARLQRISYYSKMSRHISSEHLSGWRASGSRTNDLYNNVFMHS
jgi:hypothetical protein